jgi:hypothetical protein
MPWRSVLSGFGLPVLLGVAATAVSTNATKTAVAGDPSWWRIVAVASCFDAVAYTLWGTKWPRNPRGPNVRTEKSRSAPGDSKSDP